MLSATSFPSTLLPLKSLRISVSSQTTTRKQPMAAVLSPSLYDVLGLSKAANGVEIKSAYRKLVLSCHPDVCKGSTSSADEFMRIHAAYSTLSDPSKRADYDRRLAVVGPRRQQQQQQRWSAGPASGSQSFPGYGSSRRTWETDQCW